MNLPQEVEAAAVLLFKSFSYLGSYPNNAKTGPVPLSFDAFIIAFVIIIGRLDDEHVGLSENLFFQSLSVLPDPNSTTTTVIKDDSIHEEPVIVEQPEEEEEPQERVHRGYSLADLGVDFNDLELNPKTSKPESVVTGSRILSRDLIELFVLLLWLGEADQTTHDFKRIRQLANTIVSNMKPTTDDELPCISHDEFRFWRQTFSPHLFKPLQSFVMKSFGYYKPNLEEESRLLPQDKVPKVDQSDILNSIYSTILSWALPEDILITKQWTRLYSADQDGFSMNRFESHVFKYPGPTLIIMQVDANNQSMLIGAFITQPWKHSKHLWGNSNDCFLFELDPNYEIYRPINNKVNIYYHHDFGIGFGATHHQLPLQHQHFILSLENTLQEGLYTHEPYPPQPTFKIGNQKRKLKEFSIRFETENIEVFGLGNEKDRERQAREWKFDQQEAERRAGLNIRQADGALDKELLKMAGIIDENRQDR